MKDFTPGEIYAISQYYNEKLSRQFTDHHNVVGTIRTDNIQPRDIVAEVTGVGTEKISKINQIFEDNGNEKI